ncbi:hypothetical protein ONZ45_g8313 [Pleurotus djamor]|nr:hypothetical protein ONZ45_g8313 [Pleurotus djamor]
MPCHNKQEEEALAKFRQEVLSEGIVQEGHSIGTDDETFIRFLRARKFNVKAAKKMLQDCQEWRKTVEGVGIDELYKSIDPFDNAELYLTAGRCGFTRRTRYRPVVLCDIGSCHADEPSPTSQKGRPLNVHFFGGMDLNKLYKECTPEKHWQTVLVNAESLTREILPAASRSAGRTINSVFVIVDLQGFGLSQFWQMKNLAQRSFQVSQDYYPET